MNESALLQVAIDCLRRDIAARRLRLGYSDQEREYDARRLRLLVAGHTEAVDAAPPRHEKLAA